MSFSLEGKRIWVAGHRGMVGSALCRQLAQENCTILTVGRDAVDLTNQAATEEWVQDNRPDAAIIAAARVGGILANATYPAEFIQQNLAIALNCIHAAYKAQVSKLIFLGSSCIYPRLAPQPMAEEALLTGPLETTNEWYAIAKIAGAKLCEAYAKQYGCQFSCLMPTNLYGPEDSFDLENAHVLPALLHRFHLAKETGASEVIVWGSGTPRREFLHVDDCANGIIHVLKTYDGTDLLNLGVGEDVSILDLAHLIRETVGYKGEIVFDRTKPDGTPQKLLDISRIKALGWQAEIDLPAGVTATYQWFREHYQA